MKWRMVVVNFNQWPPRSSASSATSCPRSVQLFCNYYKRDSNSFLFLFIHGSNLIPKSCNSSFKMLHNLKVLDSNPAWLWLGSGSQSEYVYILWVNLLIQFWELHTGVAPIFLLYFQVQKATFLLVGVTDDKSKAIPPETLEKAITDLKQKTEQELESQNNSFLNPMTVLLNPL